MNGYPGRRPPNYGKTYPAETLTRGEVLALMGACGRGPCGLRNRAMIAVLWRTGIRVGELVALYPKDLDRDAGKLTVLRGKGAKRRVVGIDPQALAVVERWLEARAKLGVSGRSPLFCVVSEPGRGRALRTARVREMVRYTARKAGVEKRVHPHGLRHTHAAELADEHTDLRVIQRALGHSSLKVTAHYIDHLSPTVVIETMRARSWGEGSERRFPRELLPD